MLTKELLPEMELVIENLLDARSIGLQSAEMKKNLPAKAFMTRRSFPTIY